MKQTFRIANTVLSLGMNLLIERLVFDRRWQFTLWGLIIANEIRGLIVVLELQPFF